MAVITISRQMGSLGKQIAELTAQSLGYQLVWRQLWDVAARRIGHPELALAAIDELGLLQICPSQKVCHAYQAEVQNVLLEFASQGNAVILGRAGQAVLHDKPGVLHIRITAPLTLRAERVSKLQGIALECAQAQVEASDRFRRNYLKRIYHLNWNDPTLYDLTINTESIAPQIGAHLICSAIEVLQVGTNLRPSPESPLDVC